MTSEAAYRRALRKQRRENRPLVKCAGCPAMFKPTRADQLYHNHACKQKTWRLRASNLTPLGVIPVPASRPTVTDGRSPVTVGLETTCG